MLRIVLRALFILKKIFTSNTHQIPEDATYWQNLFFNILFWIYVCVWVSYAINVSVPSEPTKNIKYPEIGVTGG